jgi:hypothetical protein
MVIINPAKAKPENKEVNNPKLSPNTPDWAIENSLIGQVKYNSAAAYTTTVTTTPVIKSHPNFNIKLSFFLMTFKSILS